MAGSLPFILQTGTTQEAVACEPAEPERSTLKKEEEKKKGSVRKCWWWAETMPVYS